MSDKSPGSLTSFGALGVALTELTRENSITLAVRFVTSPKMERETNTDSSNWDSPSGMCLASIM